MKFFEYVQALRPLIGGNLNREDYLRELFSVMTAVDTSEWNSIFDPSCLPSTATLQAIYSRDRNFSKGYAESLLSRFDECNFLDQLSDLPPAAKQTIVDSFAAYKEPIDLARFEDDVVLVGLKIIRERARVKTDNSKQVDEIRCQGAIARCKELLLARSRGCLDCGTPLEINSHDAVAADYQIVCLCDGVQDSYEESDFAVLCRNCASKYELQHTQKDIGRLRSKNAALVRQIKADQNMEIKLNLHQQINELLLSLGELAPEEIKVSPTYDPKPLSLKIETSDLLARCSTQMAIYKTYIDQQLRSLDSAGQLDYDRLCATAKKASLDHESLGMSDQEVFDRLTSWLVQHTNSGPYVCGILICYLIQICEVLRPRAQRAEVSHATS